MEEIRLIDLFNKIVNKEYLPKTIKYKGEVYEYGEEGYENEVGEYLGSNIGYLDEFETLNEKITILSWGNQSKIRYVEDISKLNIVLNENTFDYCLEDIDEAINNNEFLIFDKKTKRIYEVTKNEFEFKF